MNITKAIQPEFGETREDMILLNLPKLEATISSKAILAREDALACAKAIEKVTDSASNTKAVSAQVEIAKMIKLARDARTTAKSPLLTLGRALDNAAHQFLVPLEDEQLRLARLVGDYQSLEQMKNRAAQAQENDRLQAIERERMAALVTAKDHNQADTINEYFNLRAQQESAPVQAAPKAHGQVVKEDWELTVVDIWSLAHAHPGCVKIEPLPGQIKALLKQGIKVAGVIANKVTLGTVRVAERKAITV